MKRLTIILFTILSVLTVSANIPSGTTIYLDVSQHKCCYATYMMRSDDIGICKKMTPVKGYNGLYSYKLQRNIGNNLRFAGTNNSVPVTNGDEINKNIDDYSPWSTSCSGASTPYCIVVDDNGTCEWRDAPVATSESPLQDAQLTITYNCTKHAFVVGVYATFSATPCGLKISSPAMADDKIVKKPSTPFSYTIADNITLGQTVTATISIYSDIACTSLIEERTLSATASSQECSQTTPITACQNATTTLTASLEGDIYEWVSTNPNINGATTRSVTIPTDQLGQYTYTVKTYQINIITENNLMAGGDFENEGIGFSSDYTYVGKDVTADYGRHGRDVYTLTKDVSTFWRDFASIKPHGGDYYGFFDAESHGYAWKAETNSSAGIHTQDNPDLMIKKGEKYYFSYWAAFPNAEGTEYFSTTAATLQFQISYTDAAGNTITEQLGELYTLSNDDHDWHRQFVVWEAPISSADVMIAVYDTVTDWKGNDFCLDDIMFQSVSYSETNVAFTDIFEVTVRDCGLCEDIDIVTLSDTICDTQLPYTWQWSDTPITAIGSYTNTEQTIDGCDSVIHKLLVKECECSIPIYRKWTDFLFVDNSDSTFTSYQWYCNGEPIEGATAQYYRIADPYKTTDKYYVEIVDNQGNKDISCVSTFDNAEPSAPLHPTSKDAPAVIDTRTYYVSPNFRILVTSFEDGSIEVQKQVIL